jgi:zinc transport system substrate-binding protein
VSGLTPEAEPSPAKLAQLTQDIKSTGVKYVMSETMSTRGLPETIAAEIDVEVLKLHPLESLTPNQASEGDTYLDIMRENLTSLRTALECP